MKTRFFLVVVFSIFTLTGCSTTPKHTMTPLEIQSLQSRDYESKKEIVFPSVISVFQDIGYTISNADFQTGLISAESAANSSFAMRLLGVTSVSQTRATAFIEQIGTKTRARLSFVLVNKTSSGYGQSDRQDTPLLDGQLYESAFEKIENAIFIRSST
jgi:hypothetical protein